MFRRSFGGLQMGMQIEAFICRSDNYCVLIHDDETGVTAAVDAPDGDAILSQLKAKGWGLDLLFITHHHGDHVAGNIALKKATGCTIIGPQKEAKSIPGIGRTVADGEAVEIGAHSFSVIETPGHTTGHVAYWCEGSGLIFVGDTLFSLGCGRLFEGTAAQMFASLGRLATLPRETVLYCGHEYTADNARFALTIEPKNLDLEARAEEVGRLRSGGQNTLPTTIGQELATNPFLRTNKRRLRTAIGMQSDAPEAVFAELRHRKDNFS